MNHDSARRNRSQTNIRGSGSQELVARLEDSPGSHTGDNLTTATIREQTRCLLPKYHTLDVMWHFEFMT